MNRHVKGLVVIGISALLLTLAGVLAWAQSWNIDNLTITGVATGTSNGSDLRPVYVFDGDTGAGTQYVQGVELRSSGAGGTTELGTATNPLRVNPTGTTVQPANITQIAGTAITVGAGAVGTNTPQVTWPNNVALPAGNNNIGDVDVASFPDNEPFDLAQVSGVAIEDPYDVDGTATNERVQGVSIRTVNGVAPGASREGVNMLINGLPIATQAGVDDVTVPRVSLANNVALPPGTNSLGTVQAPQVVPQVPVAVACDDTGAINWTAAATDLRVGLWNTSTTQDVCVRWGAVAGADRTTLTTCSFVLGAYAGAGSADVWETPAGMRVGAESFCCDSTLAASLAVVAWRAE